ncbi:hypothetical protein [Nostoc sp.]|uniref:hypothetical protein n=1 Tax=Nostoc sp. TaxID=1180 RepID=UPI002FF7DA89
MVQAKRKANTGNTIGLLIPTLLQGEVEGWRNMGWAGVTQTRLELLSYLFEEDKDGPQFHRCQQQSIETLSDGPFIMVTNWQQFRFAKDNPSLWEELMGEREEIPKAEIIADLLTEYPDICVLNDQAHHVHATKKPNLEIGKRDFSLHTS